MLLTDQDFLADKHAAKSPTEVSVVVPVYNSAETLMELKRRLQEVLVRIAGDKYDIVFVNDGSRDLSWVTLKEFSLSNDRIVSIDLRRNFGQHNALMCGLAFIRGRYVVTIDDDLQTPPEEIPKLLKKMEEGYDVVYGAYRNKQHSKHRNLGSALVRILYQSVFKVPISITSFRMMRYEIAAEILSYKKSFTYIDGLIAWITTRIGSVDVEHRSRQSGRSGYSMIKLISLALNMVTNFSIIPLRIASLLGLCFSFAGFGFGGGFLLMKIFYGIPVSGFASLIVAVTVFAGVQLMTLGILGEYIGRIHLNVNERPQYSIRNVINASLIAHSDPRGTGGICPHGGHV